MIRKLKRVFINNQKDRHRQRYHVTDWTNLKLLRIDKKVKSEGDTLQLNNGNHKKANFLYFLKNGLNLTEDRNDLN